MTISQMFGKDKVVGVDIGSAVMKIAEVEPSGSGWCLARAAVCPTPQEACHDGMVNDPGPLADSLKQALAQAGVHASGAIAAVSGSQVMVRHVQLPKMPDQLLRKAVKFEASKYISTNVEESLVEYEVVGPVENQEQQQIMLVAAPRELVESRVRVLELAGLEALQVDIEPFALMRSFVEFTSNPDTLSQTVALVDLGAGHTDLNIVSLGKFALTRNIPIAGGGFTQAIKSLVGCSDEDAESLKQRIKIGPRGEGDVDEDILKASRAIQPQLDELLREIRRCLHYYQSLHPEGTREAQIGQMLLTGGASQMQGLPEYITAKLGVPTRRVNVLEESLVGRGSLDAEDASSQGSAFGVAVGLALKAQTAPVAMDKAA